MKVALLGHTGIRCEKGVPEKVKLYEIIIFITTIKVLLMDSCGFCRRAIEENGICHRTVSICLLSTFYIVLRVSQNLETSVITPPFLIGF